LGIEHEDEKEALQNEGGIQRKQIQETEQQLEQLHSLKIKGEKEYLCLKEDYNHLHNRLGEKEQQLAGLRTEFTQQLSFSKELISSSQKLEAENGKLSSHIREVDNEKVTTAQTIENLKRETSAKQN
jgi:chromosome segregation ATPase